MKRLFPLMAVVASAAVVGAYFLGRADVANTPAATAPVDAGSAQVAVDRASAASRTDGPAAGRAKGASLPMPGARLRDTFATLQARARAGDGQAATRLVRDLDTCSRLRASQWKTATATNDLTSHDTAGMSAAQLRTYQALLDAGELRQQGVKENEERCAGVTDAMLDALVPSIAQAARLGDEQARACYLGRGPLYDTRSLLAHPESLQNYRSDASALVNAGLAAGDWRVVDLLQQAYEPGTDGLLAGVLGADPVQHYRYLKLYRLGAEPHRAAKLDRELASAATGLTSMQRADADAWAQSNLHDHFEGDSTNATPEGWDACAF